jgi:hypothetical protein
VWDDHQNDSVEIQALLDRSEDVFCDFRYLCEAGLSDRRFEYALLLSACRAMRDTIDWCISSGESQPPHANGRPQYPEKAELK